MYFRDSNSTLGFQMFMIMPPNVPSPPLEDFHGFQTTGG